MKKYLLISAIVLGIAWDFLFWEKAPGVSFPIFTLACLLAGVLLLRPEGKRPSAWSLALIVPILFFSLMSFMRRDPLTTFLNFTFTLLLVYILAATYFSGLWPSFGIFDYITRFFLLLGGLFTLPWKLLAESNGAQDDESRKKRKDLVWQILRGLVLAIPLLLLFTCLLSSADLVFEKRLQDLVAFLNLETLRELLTRGLLVLGFAYAFIGLIRHAALNGDNKKLVGAEKPVVPPFLGFTENAIILGSVILLFIAFVSIQFRYFFSGELNIDVGGFTYSEYARRGFGELVAVAVISLLLVQVLSAILKPANDKQRSIFTGLTGGLVGLVLVILVSAFQRLWLYESAYGFTSLRSYSHVFMIWLGLVLVARVVIEVLGKGRFFINLVLFASLGFGLTLNLMNVDAFIVRQNVRRTVQGEMLDASYLASLTTDSVPALVDEFSSGGHTDEVHEGIGAALACQQEFLKDDASRPRAWQSFHLPDWRARKQIALVEDQLEAYQIIEEDWTREVKTPGGTIYDCWSDQFFD